VTAPTNKDSENEAGFCGEPFADNGDLLSSLSPLLTSMKLFGLYFHRKDRCQRLTDDLECKTVKTRQTIVPGLRAYATVVLILVWFNAVRMFSLFYKRDHIGSCLMLKIMIFAGMNLAAIMYTAYYYASHSGKLYKVLRTLPVTRDCVVGVRRVAIFMTAFMLITAVINLSIIASTHFTTDEISDITIAPFVTYISVPPDKVIFARTCGYLMYIFIFPGALLCHEMTLPYLTCKVGDGISAEATELARCARDDSTYGVHFLPPV